MEELVKLLRDKGFTISTMESCTGGCIVNSITNVEGSSEVIKFSAVTYSNEYKIKMGVDEEIINKYSVYSMECAEAMSKAISLYTNSDYGIGITGKLNRIDPYNNMGDNNKVFMSIYDKSLDKCYNFSYVVSYDTRIQNKNYLVDMVKEEMLNILR